MWLPKVIHSTLIVFWSVSSRLQSWDSNDDDELEVITGCSDAAREENKHPAGISISNILLFALNDKFCEWTLRIYNYVCFFCKLWYALSMDAQWYSVNRTPICRLINQTFSPTLWQIQFSNLLKLKIMQLVSKELS